MHLDANKNLLQCLDSALFKAALVTQYKPLSLNLKRAKFENEVWKWSEQGK